VSEQKVTLSDPAAADVYGWASGLLLAFRARLASPRTV
jgi:hypothetical protein